MAGHPRQETENTLVNEVTRYRTGIAALLARQVEDANTIEHKLDVVAGDDASERSAIEDIPFGPFRLHCALLLHKAVIHTKGVLSANDANNLHSLAVQMRPVLKCAGQIKRVIHNLLIEPKHIRDVQEFIERDYLGTFVRAGAIQGIYDQLLNDISRAREGFGDAPLRKLRSIRQEEKVVVLEGGRGWYKHLTENFCHGDGNWKEQSWLGGVVSTNTPQDEFTFAGHMDYLVEQSAVMNSYTALQIPSTKTLGERTEIVFGQLQKVRAEAKALRDNALAAAEQMKDQN